MKIGYVALAIILSLACLIASSMADFEIPKVSGPPYRGDGF